MSRPLTVHITHHLVRLTAWSTGQSRHHALRCAIYARHAYRHPPANRSRAPQAVSRLAPYLLELVAILAMPPALASRPRRLATQATKRTCAEQGRLRRPLLHLCARRYSVDATVVASAAASAEKSRERDDLASLAQGRASSLSLGALRLWSTQRAGACSYAADSNLSPPGLGLASEAVWAWSLGRPRRRSCLRAV